MISVGIDIGTTTTQIIFSRLEMQGGVGLQRATIAQKSILYRSPVTFTPLTDAETIDAAAVVALLRQEYRQAGFAPADIDMGAVIITGETAKKRNAAEILQALAHLAGDFVVAVAGPHLEGVIAGRGSGAAAYSRRHFTTVMNVDIGGGTANSAVFQQGRVLGAAAANVGGRLLQIDPHTQRIKQLAPPARPVLEALGLSLHPGDAPSLAQLRAFTDALAEAVMQLIAGTPSPLTAKLMLTEPVPIPSAETALFFSGGVGHDFYHTPPPRSLDEVLVHGDVGPLLAESLRRHPALARYKVCPPPETSGATVLGAGTQTVSLSGSTQWLEPERLPIRNAPVIRPHWADAPPAREQVAAAARQALIQADVDSATPVAVAVDITWPVDYPSLVELAHGLALFAAGNLPSTRTLLIIVQSDYARVLGQLIKSLAPARPLLVIDQVTLHDGDYIDLGRPTVGGQIVPLSIKTLYFGPSG
jgi:ethanolamine utilization protein EutA